MSINLPTHYAVEYSRNVNLLLQQKGSKLRDTAMVGRHVGKQASPVDQIGAIAAQPVTGRFQPMGRVDAPTDRRWVYPLDYDLPQLIDTFDKLRLLTDPSSAYVQNSVFAMGRAMDDELIRAFFADAKTGEAGGTTTSFPGTQQVLQTVGAAAATGLNVAKLRAAKRILMANEVDLEAEMPVAIITARQHDDLLGEIQVTNLDYNSRPVMVDGKVTQFLGIHFIHCERLVTDGTYRRIPVYVKSGMHLGIWNDIKNTISIRHDLQGEPWQSYSLGTFGATRIEEKKVVEIKCAES